MRQGQDEYVGSAIVRTPSGATSAAIIAHLHSEHTIVNSRTHAIVRLSADDGSMIWSK
jgi:hypothetical protein